MYVFPHLHDMLLLPRIEKLQLSPNDHKLTWSKLREGGRGGGGQNSSQQFSCKLACGVLDETYQVLDLSFPLSPPSNHFLSQCHHFTQVRALPNQLQRGYGRRVWGSKCSKLSSKALARPDMGHSLVVQKFHSNASRCTYIYTTQKGKKKRERTT